MKKILIIALIIVLIGCAVGGYFIYRHNNMYISKDEAIQVALTDSGLKTSELIECNVDFEKTRYSAWYDIDLETHGMEYDYTIDAQSGAILSSKTKND